MTDTAQIALDFARKCLGWDDAFINGSVIGRLSLRSACLSPDKVDDVIDEVTKFLGSRYWLQVNRDIGTDSKWRVLIGVQNVAHRGASRETVTATHDDLAHALMEACVLAAEQLRMGGV